MSASDRPGAVSTLSWGIALTMALLLGACGQAEGATPVTLASETDRGSPAAQETGTLAPTSSPAPTPTPESVSSVPDGNVPARPDEDLPVLNPFGPFCTQARDLLSREDVADESVLVADLRHLARVAPSAAYSSALEFFAALYVPEGTADPERDAIFSELGLDLASPEAEAEIMAQPSQAFEEIAAGYAGNRGGSPLEPLDRDSEFCRREAALYAPIAEFASAQENPEDPSAVLPLLSELLRSPEYDALIALAPNPGQARLLRYQRAVWGPAPMGVQPDVVEVDWASIGLHSADEIEHFRFVELDQLFVDGC